MGTRSRLALGCMTVLGMTVGCASGMAEMPPPPPDAGAQQGDQQEQKGPKAYSDVVTDEAVTDSARKPSESMGS